MQPVSFSASTKSWITAAQKENVTEQNKYFYEFLNVLRVLKIIF